MENENTITIKHHLFDREQVSTGSLELTYCITNNMITDIMTKGLTGKRFKNLKMIKLGRITARLSKNER